MSYYTTQGIESGSNGSSVNLIDSNNANSGDSSSSADVSQVLSEIETINNNVVALQSKITNITPIVQQFENMSSRVNNLVQIVSTLQTNSVAILGYFDSTTSLKNVYNTKYINAILNSRIPVVYDDISCTISSANNECYSTTAIKNISNIQSIPRVYKSIDKTDILSVNPAVYSTDVVDKINKKIPTYFSSKYVNNSGDNDTSIYTATYVNSLSIPSAILYAIADGTYLSKITMSSFFISPSPSSSNLLSAGNKYDFSSGVSFPSLDNCFICSPTGVLNSLAKIAFFPCIL